MAKPEINLLKTSSSLKGKLSFIEKKVTKITWWVLSGLLLVGVVIVTSYFFALTRVRQLEAKNVDLLVSIRKHAVTEGILVSLKQRSAIAAKALQTARPYGKLFPLLETIAPQTYYTTLSIDDVGRSTVTLEVPSVDEAVTTVKNVLTQVEAKTLRNPQMLSFFLKETGIVQISFSFIAVL